MQKRTDMRISCAEDNRSTLNLTHKQLGNSNKGEKYYLNIANSTMFKLTSIFEKKPHFSVGTWNFQLIKKNEKTKSRRCSICCQIRILSTSEIYRILWQIYHATSYTSP